MKKQAIHQNLSTSFVDVEALVRHLRDLRFIGSIRIESAGYEADIILTPTNKLKAREHDRSKDTAVEGYEAFRRILKRTLEPNLNVHVYRSSVPPAISVTRRIHVDPVIAATARNTIAGVFDGPAEHLLPGRDGRKLNVIDSEWNTVLELTGELLRTVDRSMAKAGIEFSEAFANACAFVAEEHPFLDPHDGLFEYANGGVRVAAVVSRRRFLHAVMKAISRIFQRLREDAAFGKLLLFTQQRLRVLVMNHREDYERLGISAALKPLLNA